MDETLKKKLNDLPENIRSKIAIRERDSGIDITASDDLKNDTKAMNLIFQFFDTSDCTLKYVSPSRFESEFSKYASRTAAGENEIQQLAIDMIARAYRQGATDIHIANFGTYAKIRFRILGMLKDDRELEVDTAERMIRTIYEHLGAAQDAPAFDNISRLDGRIVNRDYLPQGLYSIRIHVEPIEADGVVTGKGTFMPLRLMHDSSGASGTLEERLAKLGYTSEDVEIHSPAFPVRSAIAQTKLFRRLANRKGIVFISGPTGSGKSTALSHCMEALIEERPTDNFISVEDPPEKPIRGMYQIPVVSKEGADRAAAYTDAIAGTNRDDPDTIMVGEIRYAEAALATIEAALSGNAVWSTIHASDALGIIQRLSVLLRDNLTEPLDTVCDPIVLSGLVFQRLIPKLCPHCKRSILDDPLDDELMGRLERVIPHEMIWGDGNKYKGLFRRNPEGCKHCKESGHPGLYQQTVVSEVIAVDNMILSLLRAHKFEDARYYWLSELHGMSYFEHARHLIITGVIAPDMAEEMLCVPIDSDLATYTANKKAGIISGD